MTVSPAQKMPTWRSTPMTLRQRYSVRVKFEKRDAWIGLYWNKTYAKDPRDPEGRQSTFAMRVYICLVPFLPIIVQRIRGERDY